MKKVFLIALFLVMVISFVGCSSDSSAPPAPTTEAPASTTAPASIPTPIPTPAPAVTEPVLVLSDSPLAGTWDWLGSPYYVFYDDGEGTMLGMDIRWTSADGILSICNTPAICTTECIAPAEWYYIVDGNELTLTSTIIDDMAFTYTRR